MIINNVIDRLNVKDIVSIGTTMKEGIITSVIEKKKDNSIVYVVKLTNSRSTEPDERVYTRKQLVLKKCGPYTKVS